MYFVSERKVSRIMERAYCLAFSIGFYVLDFSRECNASIQFVSQAFSCVNGRKRLSRTGSSLLDSSDTLHTCVSRNDNGAVGWIILVRYRLETHNALAPTYGI